MADAGSDPDIHPSSGGSAIQHSATHEALRLYRRRSEGFLIIGLAMWIPAIMLVAVSSDYLHDPSAVGITVPLMGVGSVPLVGGLIGLLLSIRMGRVLGRHPWVPWPAVFREVAVLKGSANPTPALFLGPAGDVVLTIFTWKGRLKTLRTVIGPQVWLAGSANGGVVSPPGGHDLFWAHAPRRKSIRRRLMAGGPTRHSP